MAEYKAVSLEFLDSTVKEEKEHAVRMAMIGPKVYAKSLADQVAALADRIVEAQAEQLLTDAQITEKTTLNTEHWTPEDFDTWRLSAAKVRLKVLSEDVAHVMQSVVSLLEKINENGGE